MLRDSTALITGAGRGIGRAVALAFAREGARLVLAARTGTQIADVAGEIEAMGGRAVPVTCDVSDGASVTKAFETATARLGPVDILVNGAGMADSAPFVEVDDAMWTRTLAVNLTGTFLCMRAALPGMVARGRGRVINIASIAGRVGFAYTAAYCASKHGVLGLTRSVALEVAATGVTVNAICPGWVDTEMTTASVSRIVARTGRSPDEARRALERMSPQRRLIEPDEVAAVAVLLAGPAARGITGQAINVDGGGVMS